MTLKVEARCFLALCSFFLPGLKQFRLLKNDFSSFFILGEMLVDSNGMGSHMIMKAYSYLLLGSRFAYWRCGSNEAGQMLEVVSIFVSRGLWVGVIDDVFR